MSLALSADNAKRRRQIKKIVEAPWYTNAVLTLSDFTVCFEQYTQLRCLVNYIEVYENLVFTSHSPAFRDARLLLSDAKSVESNAVSQVGPSTQTVPTQGGGWKHRVQLMHAYQLVDKVHLYQDSSNMTDVIIRENRLTKSVYISFHTFKSIKAIFKKFLAAMNKGSSKSIFGDRLPAGSGVRQQLRDLIALERDGELRKIHRNLLLAALGINCLLEDARSISNTSTTTDIAIDDLSSILNRTTELDQEERKTLEKVFNSKDGLQGKVKTGNIYKVSLIMTSISPIVLLCPLELQKSRWSLANICSDSLLLGNCHTPLLIKIEAIIMNAIMDLAAGNKNANEATEFIKQSLPWDDIDNLDDEDPSNVRFRTVQDNGTSTTAPDEITSTSVISSFQSLTVTGSQQARGDHLFTEPQPTVSPPKKIPTPPLDNSSVAGFDGQPAAGLDGHSPDAHMRSPEPENGLSPHAGVVDRPDTPEGAANQVDVQPIGRAYTPTLNTTAETPSSFDKQTSDIGGATRPVARTLDTLPQKPSSTIPTSFQMPTSPNSSLPNGISTSTPTNPDVRPLEGARIIQLPHQSPQIATTSVEVSILPPKPKKVALPQNQVLAPHTARGTRSSTRVQPHNSDQEDADETMDVDDEPGSRGRNRASNSLYTTFQCSD